MLKMNVIVQLFLLKMDTIPNFKYVLLLHAMF